MTLPSILQVVPHGLPMSLLDELLDHGPEHVRARARVTARNPFVDANGDLPAWVGIELMAQCIAAFGGLQSRAAGEAPKIGFLLGSRHYRSECASYPAGAELIVSAHRLVIDEQGLGVFECRIDSAAGCAVANVSVYSPADPSILLRAAATI